MKKKFEDSAEFKYFDEHFDEIMEELDNDPTEYEIPEEWDARFRNVIEQTVKKEERKTRLKKVAKVCGLSAAAILLIFIFGIGFAQQAQGKSIKEFFQELFGNEKEQYVTYTTSDIEFVDDMEDNEIFFDGDTTEEVCEQARNELKKPMFYFADVLEDYEIVEAKYNSRFYTLTIQLKVNDGYAYISEEDLFNDEVTGQIIDAEKCTEVYNDSMELFIPIYKNKDSNSYVFSVKNGHMSCSFWGNISLADCKKLAESLYYK